MPYIKKKKCIYKKDTGKKVGCTKGSIDKYMKALHANVKEGVGFKTYFIETTVSGAGGAFGGSSDIGTHGGQVGNSDWYAPGDARNLFGAIEGKPTKKKKKTKKVKSVIMPVQRRVFPESFSTYFSKKEKETTPFVFWSSGTFIKNRGQVYKEYAFSKRQALFKFFKEYPQYKFKNVEVVPWDIYYNKYKRKEEQNENAEKLKNAQSSQPENTDKQLSLGI